MDEDKTSDSQARTGSEPRRSSRRIVAVALVALVAGVAVGGAGMHLTMHDHGGDMSATTAAASKKPLYRCPMHPAITADHPGDCPICGMKLVPDAPSGPESAAATKPGERRIAVYRSPMDPKQTSPVPRKDEMGMDYVPVYEDELAGAPQVAGLAPVTIDPARQQLIGLRTTAVIKGAIGATWRTPARIQIAPRQVRKTNVKVEGFVEKIFVDFVGESVRKGQPLFSIYSPSLLAAQSEYLLAVQTNDVLARGGALPEDRQNLMSSARRKLELWDVPEAELERLERTRQPTKTLTLVSPISGVVTAKNVVQGARVNPGDAPYEITDLSEVWVMADAYESDLARIRVGATATLALPAYPNRTFPGRVAFVDPLLDAKTRTTKVHLHFMNTRRELKPEMYGEVTLEGPARVGLRIPTDAIIRSGTREVVFVARGAGRFEPRIVKLGSKNGEEVEVVEGLEEGQEVVTRANFLIDSESQLRASLSAIGGK